MHERGAGQRGGGAHEDEDEYINGYGDADRTRRSAGYGPRPSAARNRAPSPALVVGALLVALGLVAAVVVTVNRSGKTGSARTRAVAAASASKSAAAAVAGPLIANSAGERAAGRLYLLGLLNRRLPGHQIVTADLFTSPTVAAKYWDSSKKLVRSAAMCGALAPNLALVAEGGGTVRVSLYTEGRLAAQEAHVAVDAATGKISGITCAPAIPPSYAGVATLTEYFGPLGYQKADLLAAKAYAPASADGPKPWTFEDAAWCTAVDLPQYKPQTWVLYAPSTTTSGAAWGFSSDGGDIPHTVFLDPATGLVERTLCGVWPVIPAPDKAAAGKPNPGNAYDPGFTLVYQTMTAYLTERSQVSRGAVPTDEIAPYFASTDAYDAALKATGRYPFLCATKAPSDISIAEVPKVSGSTETFEVRLADGARGPDDPEAPEVGHEKVVLDLGTMKIKSITCG